MKLMQYIKNFIIFLVAAIILVFFYLYYVISHIDSKTLSDEVLNAIKNSSNDDITFEEAFIDYSPYPSIAIKRISFPSGVFIDRANIYLDMKSLFLGKVNPNRIEFSELYLNVKNLLPDQNSSQNSSQNSATINDYIFKIGSIDSRIHKIKIYKIWDTSIRNLLVIKDLEISRFDKNIAIDMMLKNEMRYKDYNVFDNTTNSYSSTISIYNNNFSFSTNRIFDSSNTKSGTFSGDIYNLGDFLNDISTYCNMTLLKYIKSSGSIKISGAIANDSDYMVLSNIEITGDSIEATGNYWSPNKESTYNILDINFKKIDVNSLFSGLGVDNNNDRISAINSLKLKLRLYANKLFLFGKEINDFELLGYGMGKEFNINSCKANIGHEGNFIVSGKLQDNGLRPKFIGSISLSHDNLSKFLEGTSWYDSTNKTNSSIYLTSNVSFTPIDIMMEDLGLTLYGHKMNGNLNIKFLGSERILLGGIEFANLNLSSNEIPIVNELYSYLQSLSHGMFDHNYQEKFTPIRNFPIKSDLTVSIDNLLIENQQIDRLTIMLGLDKGHIQVDDFFLTKGKSYVKGDADLLCTSIRPIVKFNITDGEVYSKLSRANIDSILTYLNNNVNVGVVDIFSNISLQTLNIGQFNFSNLIASVDNAKNVLASKIIFSSLDGNGSLNGNMIFNPLRSNFSYSLEKFELTKLAKIVSNKIPIETGLASIGGQISTSGLRFDDIYKNLYLNGKFLGDDISINNIDINGMIYKLSVINIDEKLSNQIFQYSAHSGSSHFDKIQFNYILDGGKINSNDIIFNSKIFRGTSSLDIDIDNDTLDINSVFTFLPTGIKIITPDKTNPISVRLQTKGEIFNAEKLLTFETGEDMFHLRDLITYSINANFKKDHPDK